jgi:hypothetical protein
VLSSGSCASTISIARLSTGNPPPAFPSAIAVSRSAAHLPHCRASFDAPVTAFTSAPVSPLGSARLRGIFAASAFYRQTISMQIEGVGCRQAVAPALQIDALSKDTSMAAARSRSACSSLVRGILLYVVEHPDAKDTLEGINEFWLGHGRIHYGKTKVRDALEFLAETKHWLTKNKAGASVTLYGLNKERLAEINRYLGESGQCDNRES